MAKTPVHEVKKDFVAKTDEKTLKYRADRVKRDQIKEEERIRKELEIKNA